MEKIIAGYIPDNPDSRDYRVEHFFGAPEPFDWEKGYDVEKDLGVKLSINDQGSSYSCVGQAKSKDREIKEFIDTGNYLLQSARSVYSRRSNPGQGMWLRDACEIEQDIGITSREDTPDFKTEVEMNVKPEDGVPVTKSQSYLRFEFYNNIDLLAAYIRDFKGVMIAYDGKNNGTNYAEHPTLPAHWDEKEWAHCVFACKAVLVNGEKRIYFPNSWGEKCGKDGWQYFTEEDINNRANGYTPFYPGWVTTDIKSHNIDDMTEKFLKENEGKLIQMTGKGGTGEFAIIIDGVIRTGSPEEVTATYLARTEGQGCPKEIWNEAPKFPVNQDINNS